MDAALLRYRWTVPPAAAIPALVQQIDDRWPGQNTAPPPDNSQSLTRTIALPGNITAGNSIVIQVCHFNSATSPGGTVSFADNLGNTFPAAVGRVDDLDASANMSLYLFFMPRITTGGAQTITATFPYLEWQSLLVMEWSGLANQAPLDWNGSVQTSTTTASDFLTTGNIVGGSNAGIFIGQCLNGTDQNTANGGGVGSPNCGTGFTAVNSGTTDWSGIENSFVGPACQPEYLYSTNLGTRAMTYTAKKAAESYVSIGMALKAG